MDHWHRLRVVLGMAAYRLLLLQSINPKLSSVSHVEQKLAVTNDQLQDVNQLAAANERLASVEQKLEALRKPLQGISGPLRKAKKLF